jgi:putative endonuclease
MKVGWVYIMTNQPFGPLYVGVTNDIQRRVGEHKAHTGSKFAAK